MRSHSSKNQGAENLGRVDGTAASSLALSPELAGSWQEA